MTKISPFIKFNDGKCREAMTFYKDIIGGELEFMTVAGTPMEKDLPGKQDLIMHSTLKMGDWYVIGSDMMMDKAVMGDGVGLCFECDTEEELRNVFNKLTEGGKVFMPVEEQFWGAWFGVVTDKYGVEWMLNCQKK